MILRTIGDTRRLSFCIWSLAAFGWLLLEGAASLEKRSGLAALYLGARASLRSVSMVWS
ncbi:MAG: hypothetical protein ACRDJG_11960 [Actinomycetota bacterium]